MRRLVVASEYGLVAERIRRFFSHRGYRVELVRNGVECLASLKRGAPDALVLDWNLPWGGGAGVLACMRETPGIAEVPVILLADQFSHELDMDEPVNRCLGISSDVGSLYEAVDWVLQDTDTIKPPRFRFQPAGC